MIRDRGDLVTTLRKEGQHAIREEEVVKEGGGAVIRKGERARGGMQVAEGVPKMMSGGELPHDLRWPVIPVGREARRQRPPFLPPIHREVEVPSDDAVPPHPREERVEALLNEQALSHRIP